VTAPRIVLALLVLLGGPTPEPAPPGQAAGTTDLLRAVETTVVTSSAYRDRSTQVGRLLDGDLATAWNSRTGDLAGAWIEVSLPANATVTTIALTAGFTAPASDGRDLYTGNHRVSRVRVLRDGQAVGTYPLDVASRALQRLPVSGPGGVYRIVLDTLTPGSREDWREACVSELRVLGRAPDAEPGRRFPRYGVGSVPPAPAPAADRPRAIRALRDRIPRLLRGWWAYEEALLQEDQQTGEPGITRPQASRFGRERRGLLEGAERFVGVLVPAAADPLRLARAINPGAMGNAWPTYRRHFDLVVASFDRLTADLGDAPVACAWHRAHAELRLRRLALLVATQNEYDEVSAAMDGIDAPDLYRWVELTEELAEGFRASPRTSAIRARRRLRLPARYGWFAPEEAGLHDAIDGARDACGWEGVPPRP
jgi:hypothetical protein